MDSPTGSDASTAIEKRVHDMNHRSYLIRNHGWKSCHEDNELCPRVCRTCHRCRKHCTCDEFDKFIPREAS